MVVEVMGRYAGWIALYAGVGGGADVILIPEIPVRHPRRSPQRITARDAWGAHFSIVVVAEGAKPKDGDVSLIEAAASGKASDWAAPATVVAAELEQLTGKETRTVVLGHLQRGGRPPASTACWPRASAATAVDVLLRRRARLHGGVSTRPTSSTVPLDRRSSGKTGRCRWTRTS